MEINTKYFGTLPYSLNEEILFEFGLFGFEENKKFVLIRFDNAKDALLSLQSVEDEHLAFVLMNPFIFLPDYNPILTDRDLAYFDVESSASLSFYNICVIRDDINQSTVNLRCPLVINPSTRKAKQIVLEDTEYAFKFKFAHLVKKGG